MKFINKLRNRKFDNGLSEAENRANVLYKSTPDAVSCEYCGDTVIVLRKVDCENYCPYGVEEDNGECGELPKCPSEESYYYENVCDNENAYCPMCGKNIESEDETK